MPAKEIIEAAINGRLKEIALYDVNISNFRHIIERIEDGDCAQMLQFREELKARLATEEIERRKTMMVLDALQAQQA